jgi:outer membrane lipase/esterase
MYIIRPRNSLLFLIVVFHVYKIQSQGIPYDTIVCFGDSLSDTGNVYNLTGKKWPVVPPYYLGRFSDGPVWVEKLGISNLINYAYGSATSDNNLVQGYTEFQISVPGVRQQIILYKNTTNLNQFNFNRTVYAIWVDGNDYFFDMTLSPSVVVNSIMNGIKDLIQFGAKRFIILNQTPLQTFPAAAAYNLTAYLTTLTLTHNSNLSNSIQVLQSNFPNISLQLFDVASLITNISTNPSTYGLSSIQNCWNTLNGTIVVSCTTPDTYLFIDEYHFTTRVHQLIANNVRALLSTSNGNAKSPYSILLVLSFFIFLLLLNNPIRSSGTKKKLISI